MHWVDSHIMQLSYYIDFLSESLPVVLTVAVIFTFFIVQSFSRKLDRMSFFLDRIDNHLSEIAYLLKRQEKNEDPGQSGHPDKPSGNYDKRE
ncbi:hypothetical protein LLH00_05095 [bacterium]|nr:hypothetical protein [bacterium]